MNYFADVNKNENFIEMKKNDIFTSLDRNELYVSFVQDGGLMTFPDYNIDFNEDFYIE